MYVLSISGKARAGKTTLAKLIAGELYGAGYTPKIRSFATPLKEMLAQQGITKETATADDFRDAAQSLSDSVLEADPKFFVNRMIEEIASIYEASKEFIKSTDPQMHCPVVIIDDMRYPWELDILSRYNGLWLHVNPGNRKLQDHKAAWRKHRSEAMAADIDAGTSAVANSVHFTFVNDKDEGRYHRLVTCVWPHLFPFVENDEIEHMCSCENCGRIRRGGYDTLERLEMELRTLEMHTAANVAASKKETK